MFLLRLFLMQTVLAFSLCISATANADDDSSSAYFDRNATPFDMAAATKIVDAAGFAIPVIDFGEGPVVLLLHGWPDSKELWRNQIPALAAQGYRVIAPDLIGLGDAPKPLEPDVYGLGAQIGIINALLDNLNVSTASLVGHDFGAAIAWTLARFVPQRFTTLTVLSNGSPSATNTALNTIEQRRRFWYLYFFLQEGLAEFGISENNYQFMRDFTDHPDIDRIIADISRPDALTASLNWYRANTQSLIAPADGTLPPPPPPLPNVIQPTLGIWGQQDQFLTAAQMSESAVDVDNEFIFKRVRNAGHWLMLDRPRRINRLLIGFLNCKVKGSCYY